MTFGFTTIGIAIVVSSVVVLWGFAPRRGIMIVDMFSKHLWTRNSWRRSDGAGRNAGTFVPPANQEIGGGGRGQTIHCRVRFL